MSIEEYFCTYCDDFLPQMEVVMACPHCGEYKGVIKVTKLKEDTPWPTAEKPTNY